MEQRTRNVSHVAGSPSENPVIRQARIPGQLGAAARRAPCGGVLPVHERLGVVQSYFRMAGGYDEPEALECSPAGVDPLWIVTGRRAA